MLIESHPNGEGPCCEVFSATHQARGFEAALAQLPTELPPATSTKPCDDLGRFVVISLRDGHRRKYGPCGIPPTVLTATEAAMQTYATGSITVALVDQAIATCRNAVRPGSLIMAQPTTVGVIIGEGEYVLDRRVPVTDAFPNAARRDFAAWCARHEPNGREMYYAALPNGEIAAAKP